MPRPIPERTSWIGPEPQTVAGLRRGARMSGKHVHRDPAWERTAIGLLREDAASAHPTPLIEVPVPAPGISFYLKDESALPTGSLKHRLAHALFLHAICNGWIRRGTHVVEVSSGSTAVSAAYFARTLGLPFTAVVPESTSPAKIALVEEHGGRVERIPAGASLVAHAMRLGRQPGCHHLDQFANGERAIDWRSPGTIAGELVAQVRATGHLSPTWVVTGAGTGTTATTLGRHIRLHGLPTRLCVVDPARGSVYRRAWQAGDRSLVCHDPAPLVEGIGRPLVASSFELSVVDDMLSVEDAAAVAAARWVERTIGISVGASTGAAVWGALDRVARMRRVGIRGAVVAILADRGERYADTIHDDAWLARRGVVLDRWTAVLERFERDGVWPCPRA